MLRFVGSMQGKAKAAQVAHAYSHRPSQKPKKASAVLNAGAVAASNANAAGARRPGRIQGKGLAVGPSNGSVNANARSKLSYDAATGRANGNTKYRNAQ